MKKAILIGDSICFGYQQYVIDAMKDVAEVYYPHVNGAFAQNVLRYVNVWKDEFHLPEDADIVHFNAGLWDVLRICGDEPLTSREYYAELLPRIVKRLRLLFPKAKIVFALSTAVAENLYEPPYQRYNADIKRYNETAMEALKDFDVIINDLYAVTKDLPEDSVCRSDYTHYNSPEGVALIGDKVIEKLCEVLEIPLSSVKTSEACAATESDKFLRN